MEDEELKLKQRLEELKKESLKYDIIDMEKKLEARKAKRREELREMNEDEVPEDEKDEYRLALKEAEFEKAKLRAILDQGKEEDDSQTSIARWILIIAIVAIFILIVSLSW